MSRFRILTISALVVVASCSGPKQFSTSGTVTGISRGKDGYTAGLKGANGRDYDAVISRTGLQERYEELKEGDRVKVWGDSTLLGDKTSIRVKKISHQ